MLKITYHPKFKKTILKIQERVMKKQNVVKNEIIIDFFKIGYGSLGIDSMSCDMVLYIYCDVKIRLDSKR